MKSIKFRIWMGDHFKKVPEKYVGTRCAHICMKSEQDESSCKYILESKEDRVFQLWSGLKDKYGKEIYEGDIVAFDFIDRDRKGYEVKAAIEFVDGSFRENWMVDDPRYRGYHLLKYTDNSKIVGNIFEGIKSEWAVVMTTRKGYGGGVVFTGPLDKCHEFCEKKNYPEAYCEPDEKYYGNEDETLEIQKC